MAVDELRSNHTPGQTVQAIVVGLWRYPVCLDEYKAVSQEEYSDHYNKLYDVELCDVCSVTSRQFVRCIVSSHIYDTVRKGSLVPGHVVEISQWKVTYDETVVPATALIIISEISNSDLTCACGEVHHDALVNAGNHQAPALLGKADLCFNAFTREDPVGQRRLPYRQELIATGRAECQALLTGSQKLSQIPLGRNRDPVCGRVLKKDRLTCYVPKKKPEKFPFTFQIVLADESDTVHVFFWHQMALACHDSIQEADILVCHNFNVKPYIHDNQRVEIALDPCNDPSDHVNVLPDRLLPAALVASLPAMDYNFLDISTLLQIRERNLSVNDEFSVAGLVVHASPWQRYRDKDVPQEFFQSRMVALRDETSDQLVLVRIYAFSDEKKFLAISTGRLIVVTCCAYGRVGSEEVAMSAVHIPARSDLMVITTTVSSQVHILQCPASSHNTYTAVADHSIFLDQQKVQDTARWLDNFDDITGMCFAAMANQEVLQHDRVLLTPIPLDMDVNDLSDIIELKNNFELVTGANLVSVLDALDYRESKTLFIHATLVSISFACSAPALTTHATSDGQDVTASRQQQERRVATLTPATQEQQQPRRRFLSSRRHIVDTADDDEGSVPRSVLTARQREPLVSQQGPSSHGARTLLGRGLRLQGQLATDIVVSGSNTEDTDDDGSLPQLGQMLQFGRTHFAATAASGSSSSAGVAAGRGISSPRRVTLPTVSALPLPRNAPVDHRQVRTTRTLANVDGIPELQGCGSITDRSSTWSIVLQTLNGDQTIRIPMRQSHAVSRYSQQSVDLRSQLDADGASAVFYRGLGVDVNPTDGGLQDVDDFLDGVVSEVGQKHLLVMLDAYRASLSHVCTTFMGAFPMERRW